MKGKLKQNRKKKKGNAVFEKYVMAVDEFVKSKSGTDEAENDHGLRFVKKKSRKELRKEKRKMKKARMKSHYEGKKTLTLPDSDGGTSGISSEKQKKTRIKMTKTEVNNVSKTQSNQSSGGPKEKPNSSKTLLNSKKGKKINKLQESRKMALIEANQQEDREIKKLERCLGLNKRKNKKSLPQSFVADGLDYILGVLDSGSSATGVYDDDDDMDMAKENFEKLGENDSQLSDDNEELGDDMSSEGSTEDIGSCDDEADDDDDDEMDEGDDDDELNDEEEEEEEEMENELDDSDAAGSDNENEVETEEEVDTSHIKTSDTKSESVSSKT